MSSTQTASEKYTMRISRLTIDKLGIQMYDRVSAVLAELIANCYDADAERVEITLPFGKYLAERQGSDNADLGYEISIKDDGVGMLTHQVNDYYLKIGINRRSDRGDQSSKGRRVLGRKGIGKLAPFGICREIEVVTAGGQADGEGQYAVSNLVLRYDGMLLDEEQEYHPQPGPLDNTTSSKIGTTIILRDFDRRRVPSKDALHRQIAARFGGSRNDWHVAVINTEDDGDNFEVGELEIPLLDGTKVIVDDRPIELPEGEHLAVTGWVGYSKDPYRDDAMAGVRVFARGKIAAQTRDFDIESGFTGEYKMRSYVVGEIHADWLDVEEDLIRSDRQGIIWTSEKGEAAGSPEGVGEPGRGKRAEPGVVGVLGPVAPSGALRASLARGLATSSGHQPSRPLPCAARRPRVNPDKPWLRRARGSIGFRPRLAGATGGDYAG